MNWKYIGIIVIIIFAGNCNIQKQVVSEQKIIINNDCIIENSPITFIDKDKKRSIIHKKEIPDLISSLKNCETEFKYSGEYEDSKFEMMIPNDMKFFQFEYGNDNFGYQFYTNDKEYSNSITIYYDFIERNKNHFYERIEEGKLKVEIEKVNGKNIYYFKNWQKRNCGKIFLGKKQSVMYCTSNIEREEELKEMILTFKRK